MWESLPPVVSVATAADDLIGVSMAVQAEGMLNASLSDSAPPMRTNTTACSQTSTMRSCSVTTAAARTSLQHAIGPTDARLVATPPSESTVSTPPSKGGLAHTVTSSSAPSLHAPAPPSPWELTSTLVAARPSSPLPLLSASAPHAASATVPLRRESSGAPLQPARGSLPLTSSPASTAPANALPCTTTATSSYDDDDDDDAVAAAAAAAAQPHFTKSSSASVTGGSCASPPSNGSVMGAAAASIVWASPASASGRSGPSSNQVASRGAAAAAAAAHATANASDATAPADGQAVLYAAVNPFKDLHHNSKLRSAPSAAGRASPATRPSQPAHHTPQHHPSTPPYAASARQQRVLSSAPTTTTTTGAMPLDSPAAAFPASASPATSAATAAAALPPSPALKASGDSGFYRSPSFTATSNPTTAATASPARVTRVPSGPFRDSTGAAYPRHSAPAPAPPPPPASLWETGQPAGYTGALPKVFTAASASSGGALAGAVAPASMSARTFGSPYAALPTSFGAASPPPPPHQPHQPHQQQLLQLQHSQRSFYGSINGGSGRRSVGGGEGSSPRGSSHAASHVRFQGAGNGASPAAAGLAAQSPSLPHLRPGTPGRYAYVDSIATPSVPPDGSISLAGAVDHNQSFYMGTMGNDNLRRSFFFPLGPAPGAAGVGTVVWPEDPSTRSGEVSGPAAEVPPYMHAASLSAARAPGRTTPSTAQMGALAPNVYGGDGKPSPSVSSLTADPYCSPTLFHAPSFRGLPLQRQITPQIPPTPPPPASSIQYQHAQLQAGQAPSSSMTPQLQPAQSSLPNTSAGSDLTAATLLASSAQTASAAPCTYVPVNPQAPSSLYDSPGAIAQPLTLSMAATYGRRGGAGQAPWQAGRAAQPPALAGAAQQQQHLGMAASSRSSSIAGMAEASRITGFTDSSFLSPTLANSTWQQRFEEAGTGLSQERILALPDSSAQAHARLGAQQPPLTLSASETGTSGRRWSSSTASSQAKPAPPALPAPPPPYIVDWEQSLVAFQNRAESYYTFKNVCTETYLTLIEHDVDRFLVCYYSGGVIPPEEAVHEALARRGNFNAGTGGGANTGAAGGGEAKGSGGRGSGGGIQKMLQGSKTLMKLGETGSKWLSKVGTNLRRNSVAAVATPASPNATEPPQTPLSNAATAVFGDGRPLPLTSATAPGTMAVDGSLDTWATPTTMAAPAQLNAGTGRDAIPDAAAAAYSGSDANAGVAQAGPTRSANPFADNPLKGGRAAGAEDSPAPSRDSVASLGAVSSISGSVRLPSSSAATSALRSGDATSTSAATSAAEAEVSCLRQLGPYVANVVPETYMDVRPSEGVLAQVRRNHAILVHAMQHVLTDATGGAEAQASDGRSPSTPAALTQMPSPATSSSLGFAPPAPRITVDTLVTRRLRTGLLQPTIQATWRDYLTPLESKVGELAQIATENIEPILCELRAPRSLAEGAPGEGALASAPPSLSLGTSSNPAQGLWRDVTLAGGHLNIIGSVPAMSEGDRAARAALCAAREAPVARLVRLLRGDEEYLAAIHTMDDEFLDNGAAWQQRSAQLRLRGAALSDYVPVYGLVLSRLHRLEMEHRTVLELWGGGAR